MDKECPYRFMLPKEERGCIEHRCVMYRHYLGKHPQTNADVDVWDCCIPMEGTLLMEVARWERQTGANVHHQTNQHFATFRAIQLGMPIPALSGNLERDEKTLKQLSGASDGKGDQ